MNHVSRILSLPRSSSCVTYRWDFRQRSTGNGRTLHLREIVGNPIGFSTFFAHFCQKRIESFDIKGCTSIIGNDIFYNETPTEPMQSRIIAGSEYRYATSSREKMNALMAQRMYIIETVTRHYANLRNLDNSLPEMPDIRALKLVELKQLDAEILIAHATKVRKRAEESKDPVQRKKAW